MALWYDFRSCDTPGTCRSDANGTLSTPQRPHDNAGPQSQTFSILSLVMCGSDRGRLALNVSVIALRACLLRFVCAHNKVEGRQLSKCVVAGHHISSVELGRPESSRIFVTVVSAGGACVRVLAFKVGRETSRACHSPGHVRVGLNTRHADQLGRCQHARAPPQIRGSPGERVR